MIFSERAYMHTISWTNQTFARDTWLTLYSVTPIIFEVGIIIFEVGLIIFEAGLLHHLFLPLLGIVW